PPDDEWARTPTTSPQSAPTAPPHAERARSVTPPWHTGDRRRPDAPPPLRLVEPTLPDDLREELESLSAPPPQRQLRLVGSERPISEPPVEADESDSDLLIFAQTRSAWFSARDKNATWAW